MKYLIGGLFSIIFLSLLIISYIIYVIFRILWDFKFIRFKEFATLEGNYLFSNIYSVKDFFIDIFFIKRHID